MDISISVSKHMWSDIKFRGNPNFDATFSSPGFSLCVEILNIIFKTVNCHLIVHEHGIDTIFLIYYFE